MKTHADKPSQNKQRSAAHAASHNTNNRKAFQLVDNRSASASESHNPSSKGPVQRQKNNTGLPDALKSGIEQLSGHSMDDVKVHYNSNRPAQLNAHAYAQGTAIHVASGQEKHLAHEAWHVVQQKQGRVKPTKQLKGNLNINDDSQLEREADRMGAEALQVKAKAHNSFSNPLLKNSSKDTKEAPLQPMFIKGGGLSEDLNQYPTEEALEAFIKQKHGMESPLDSSPDKHPGLISQLFNFMNTEAGADLKKSILKLSPAMPNLHVDLDAYKKEDSKPATLNFKSLSDQLTILNEKRKRDENPDIWKEHDIKSPEDTILLNTPQIRKLNRISGLLKHKNGGAIAMALDAIITDFVKQKSITPNLVNVNLKKQLDTLYDTATKKDDDRTDLRWCFQTVNFVITALESLISLKDIEGIKSTLSQEEIRFKTAKEDLWVKLQKNEEFRVIAHRGDGATFDKMGKYYYPGQHDNEYKHLPENSKESTERFMDAYNHTLKTDKTPKLNGIECDIYLNKEGIPYVTHTAHVKELEKLEKSPGKTGPFDLKKSSAEHIKDMHSSEIPERVLPLATWLNLIDNKVKESSLLKSKFRLRIELEMKDDHSFTKAEDKHKWNNVFKVVNHFLKASKYSHCYEIAMFNNSITPIEVKDEIASKKTMVSNVTFGAGPAASQSDMIKALSKSKMTEMRFGMHLPYFKKIIEGGYFQGKVMTFAPGLNHPDGKHPQLLPVGWPKDQVELSIEQSHQAARFENYLKMIKKLEERFKPVAIQVLTDHGILGAESMRSGSSDLRLMVQHPDDKKQIATWQPSPLFRKLCYKISAKEVQKFKSMLSKDSEEELRAVGRHIEDNESVYIQHLSKLMVDYLITHKVLSYARSHKKTAAGLSLAFVAIMGLFLAWITPLLYQRVFQNN